MKRIALAALAVVALYESKAMDIGTEFRCQTTPQLNLYQSRDGRLQYSCFGLTMNCKQLFLKAGSNMNGIIPKNDLNINGDMTSAAIEAALKNAFACRVTVIKH
jgi:hypothetical protein